MEDVGKAFRSEQLETHALAGIYLSIGSGESVALIGPSGCGKSTLLAVMGLFERPTAGCYRLGSRDTAMLTDEERIRVRWREIGWVFGAASLHAGLSVGDNIALAFAERSPGADRAGRQVREVLDRVGFAGRIEDSVGELSGGERQQVAVARATVGSPRLLLADEPTRNLDASGVGAVLDAFGWLQRSGTTICMATHDPGTAARADRIVRLLDGRVVGEECPIPPDPSRNPTGPELGGRLESLSHQ